MLDCIMTFFRRDFLSWRNLRLRRPPA